MDKSPDAFRTISEVAEVLDTPAHVLRFWESRFPQIRPVKRAGGRRYYRPADMALLTGIKHLLHDEGMTIRGVQKVLREQGVRFVAGLSGHDIPDETEDAEAALEAALAANFGPADDGPADDGALTPQDEVETAQILALETALRPRDPLPEGTNQPPAEVVTLFDTPAPTLAPHPAPTLAQAEVTASVPFDLSVDAPMVDLPEDASEDAPEFDAHSLDTLDLDAPYGDAVEPVAKDFAPDPAPDAAQRTASDPVPEAAHWLDPELDPELAPQLAQDAPRAADLPLIDRLRALPPGSLANNEYAAALRDRLAVLANRVSAPPPHAPL